MSEWVSEWANEWVRKWVSALRQSNSSCHMQTFISSVSRFFMFFAFPFSFFAFNEKRKAKNEKRKAKNKKNLDFDVMNVCIWHELFDWRIKLTHSLSNSLTHSDTHSLIHVLRHLTVTTWNRPLIEKRKAKSEKQTNFWKTKSEKRKAN